MGKQEQQSGSVPIRSVSRAIRVLQIVNRLDNPTIMEVKEESKLPYPTVFRIIMTLAHEGLIECEPSRKRYRPTELVWSLVTGFQQDDLLVAKSREHLVALTAELHWPVAITVRVGDRMIIKDSTHTLTAQTFDNYYPGYTLPILDTAAGKCFLAYCSDEERKMIFDSVSAYGDEEAQWSLRIAQDEGFLEGIRGQGFATHARAARASGGGKTAAVAVPIIVDDVLKACLALVYFYSAMDMKKATEKYGEALRRTADVIGASLAASDAKRAEASPPD